MAEDAPPTVGQDIARPPAELVARLRAIGSATISGELNRLGVRSAAIAGPVPRTPSRVVAGPALTLQLHRTCSTTRKRATSWSSTREAT